MNLTTSLSNVVYIIREHTTLAIAWLLLVVLICLLFCWLKRLVKRVENQIDKEDKSATHKEETGWRGD